MEAVKEVTHKEKVLKALSQMPIATTNQISKLFKNNSPLKRASENLNELEDQKLVEWEWHRRSKVWRLTTKGIKQMEISRMKFEHVDHTLAVGDVYFTLQPNYFMFEPVERFSYPAARKELVFNPDCIFVRERKVYVCEVQRKDRSKKEWAAKWDTFNRFFEEAYTQAEYQKWSNKGNILPQFVVITTNKFAAEGFNIPQRELKIISDITQLG